MISDTLAIALAGASLLSPQGEGTEPVLEEVPVAEEDASFKVIEYTSKGLDIRSEDGNFHAHINWRAQLRLTESTFDEGSIDLDLESREGAFKVNRFRFKLGGHAYRPWLKYYMEYDFPRAALLDMRFTLEKIEALQMRVGQWKVPYSRERVDSSGKQQFVDRSIANPYFTLDRQQGVALFGRLWNGKGADSWYNLGVYSGTGRGGEGSTDRPLVLGRWQWNFLGRDLAFSQSDTGYREKPAGSFALAAAGWRGPYTAFSTRGGGQLPGFDEGTPDRYDVRQAMFETAFQYSGFSWQQEWHYKRVDDTEVNAVTELDGGYAQVGVFGHTLLEGLPKPLEMALRAAQVDPDRGSGEDRVREASLVFNWFFNGHSNKLSLDLSRLNDKTAEAGRQWETRLRLQWDVSF